MRPEEKLTIDQYEINLKRTEYTKQLSEDVKNLSSNVELIAKSLAFFVLCKSMELIVDAIHVFI